jgi:hypothetical protein
MARVVSELAGRAVGVVALRRRGSGSKPPGSVARLPFGMASRNLKPFDGLRPSAFVIGVPVGPNGTSGTATTGGRGPCGPGSPSLVCGARPFIRLRRLQAKRRRRPTRKVLQNTALDPLLFFWLR